MKELLFVVEDVFEIENRGCVLVPGVSRDAGVRPRAGDHVLLKRPDGSEQTATLGGMQIGGKDSDPGAPILLLGIGKTDIPIGTGVWLL